MHKSADVHARVERSLKADAEVVLREMGITPTQAVTMLYKSIVRQREWPVELKVPNEETCKVLDETDQGIDIIRCKDAEEFYKKLGI